MSPTIIESGIIRALDEGINMYTLTDKQAYKAMFLFLEQIYYRKKSDELGGLLGSMRLLEDGSPADPAFANDWANAVAAALRKQS